MNRQCAAKSHIESDVTTSKVQHQSQAVWEDGLDLGLSDEKLLESLVCQHTELAKACSRDVCLCCESNDGPRW